MADPSTSRLPAFVPCDLPLMRAGREIDGSTVSTAAYVTLECFFGQCCQTQSLARNKSRSITRRTLILFVILKTLLCFTPVLRKSPNVIRHTGVCSVFLIVVGSYSEELRGHIRSYTGKKEGLAAENVE
ncbi:hypothetical protein PoB_006397300 [Plakobranchus ocellatus]|uniref:Uncharacterized protein n=1 Tax=Plakobranchus ocellatus TaxID=259542 RepID=A0AAV4CZV6_9GAST|nr:hypothetical protein PoB_006397300 [Plakobranchus ocellatus]